MQITDWYLTPTKWTTIGGRTKVTSYDMLGEQNSYFNPVRYGQNHDVVNLLGFEKFLKARLI